MGTFDQKLGVYRKQGGAFSEKGSSDILGIWRGRFLALEVKSRRGTLRPEQKLFIEEMQRLGAIAGVVRSLQDAIDLLESSNKSNFDQQTSDDS
jgi:Holliday junction resolvase